VREVDGRRERAGEGGAMTIDTFWHVGILVQDLEGAAARFSEVLGVTFGDPVEAHFDELTETGEIEPQKLRVAFSREGPPHYELCQAHDSGIWGRQQGDGVHHLALWEDDVGSRLTELRRFGVDAEMLLRTPDKNLVAYLSPRSVHGIRFEVVASGLKPIFGY
jgi:catechol 2,3-dioxygenase-like lactoylglutathione lyase family enzyme